MSYITERESVLSDFSASYWIKKRIGELEGRDSLDAVADCEVLLRLMELRANEILGAR